MPRLIQINVVQDFKIGAPKKCDRPTGKILGIPVKGPGLFDLLLGRR